MDSPNIANPSGLLNPGESIPEFFGISDSLRAVYLGLDESAWSSS